MTTAARALDLNAKGLVDQIFDSASASRALPANLGCAGAAAGALWGAAGAKLPCTLLWAQVATYCSSSFDVVNQ